MEEIVSKLNYNDQYLAYKQLLCKSNGNIIFFGGYNSNMHGRKAEFLHNFCVENNFNFLRFDYFGHGLSSGTLAEGTISIWLENALAIIDKLISAPCVIVGSSMGGWIAPLVALRRPNLVKAIMGIASAPDFTELLVWQKLSEEKKAILAAKNFINYGQEICGEDFPFTYNLIKDGRKHLILGKQININCPVYLLHGMKDVDVPYEFSLIMADKLRSKNVRVILKKDSEHRMSTEDDLNDLGNLLKDLVKSAF